MLGVAVAPSPNFLQFPERIRLTYYYYDDSSNNMKCPRCGYEWEGRVEKPKACPECKGRLWRSPILVGGHLLEKGETIASVLRDSAVSMGDTRGAAGKGGENHTGVLAPTEAGQVRSSQPKQPASVRPSKSGLPFPSHKKCSVYGCMQCKANSEVAG